MKIPTFEKKMRGKIHMKQMKNSWQSVEYVATGEKNSVVKNLRSTR